MTLVYLSYLALISQVLRRIKCDKIYQGRSRLEIYHLSMTIHILDNAIALGQESDRIMKSYDPC